MSLYGGLVGITDCVATMSLFGGSSTEYSHLPSQRLCIFFMAILIFHLHLWGVLISVLCARIYSTVPLCNYIHNLPAWFYALQSK